MSKSRPMRYAGRYPSWKGTKKKYGGISDCGSTTYHIMRILWHGKERIAASSKARGVELSLHDAKEEPFSGLYRTVSVPSIIPHLIFRSGSLCSRRSRLKLQLVAATFQIDKSQLLKKQLLKKQLWKKQL